jgi:hypothetical protein
MEMKIENDILCIIKMQPLFGKHANLVWAYISLFQVTPMKAKTAKIRVLLEWVKTLLEGEQFDYQKKVYRISARGILEALNVCVHRNFDTPLSNHNYLKSCMISIAEREAKETGRAQEKDLRAKEHKIMAGDREEEKGFRDPGCDEKNLERVKGFLKGIG